MTEAYATFARAIVAYGGRITEVPDLAAVADYALTRARARAPQPRLVVERPLLDTPGWTTPDAPMVTVMEPRSPPSLRQAIIDADVGVGLVDHAVVDSGQAVIYRSGEWGRLLAYLAPIYIGVVRRSTFVPSLAELLVALGPDGVQRFSAITFVAGCSVSADIENIPTPGVHGPLELHLLVLP